MDKNNKEFKFSSHINEQLLDTKDSKLHINSANDIYDEDVDYDLISKEECNRLFQKCEQITQMKVSHDNDTYILHINATFSNHPKIAVGLSNNTCKVLTLENELVELATLEEHQNPIVGVKFIDDNLLYTGSSDTKIFLWDLRTSMKKVAKVFDKKHYNVREILSCFDISPNDVLICGGTELSHRAPYLLFWDIRSTDLLGGYWDSNHKDITQVRFSKDDADKLICGNDDGLINLYNLTEYSESKSLIGTFNVGSSVERLSWHEDEIICITSTYDVQFWKIDSSEPRAQFHRTNITTAMQRKNETFTYIVDVHPIGNKKFMLCGSNHTENFCLRGLRVHKELEPAFNFTKNKQIVRCSWFNENLNMLFTGGEEGILNLWSTRI